MDYGVQTPLIMPGAPPQDGSSSSLVAAARADLARYGGFRNTLLFDQRIGNTYVFTQPDLNELFGQVDTFRLVVYVDGRSNVGLTQMTLLLSHSPDGLTWASFPYWIDNVTFPANTMFRVDNNAFTFSSYARRLLVGVVGDPGTAARVRIWATSRGRSQRRFHEPLFDQFVAGTAPVYTDESLGWLLGSADVLLLFAIADDVSGTAPTLTVQIEESPDGQSWREKTPGSPELTKALLTGATTTAVGQDTGSAPTAAFVRMRISLGGTSPAAHVRLFATGWGL